MNRYFLGMLLLLPGLALAALNRPVAQRPWFATQTAHFSVFSCGAPQSVFQVAARFEQFCQAYDSLAGAAAITSPPIVVLAFPDPESMKPFLPLYHDQPEPIAAFFNHGYDENLIVLSLPKNPADLNQFNVIFHEYTHLLLRRNDRVWPLWLKEGMAEIYSTFTTAGNTAFIALPIEPHLHLLATQPLLPLADLFAVRNDSPDYNERDRQGLFYAESWLLAHYLTAGDNPVLKARFRSYTPLLLLGQTPLQAFTNALQLPLVALEKELRRYRDRNQFTGISFNVPDAVAAPKNLTTRALANEETEFRLGDELLRIGRLDDAERWFVAAQTLAPHSPLPHEGLGLLAVQREQTGAAIDQLRAALLYGSGSYLAYYLYAREQFHSAAEAPGGPDGIPAPLANELRAELLKSLTLMPDFGPAHELFAILEMGRGGQPMVAEEHLLRAIQLEPENAYYQLALADAQVAQHKTDEARRTLNGLLLPNVESKIRTQAQALLQKLN